MDGATQQYDRDTYNEGRFKVVSRSYCKDTKTKTIIILDSKTGKLKKEDFK